MHLLLGFCDERAHRRGRTRVIAFLFCTSSLFGETRFLGQCSTRRLGEFSGGATIESLMQAREGK